MERQLNNPLRPSTKPIRSETPSATSQAPTPLAAELQPLKKPIKEQSDDFPTGSRLPTSASPNLPPAVSSPTSPEILKPEVRKALDALHAPEEFRKLMLQLANNGIEIAGPKKTYIKHSYEIDQELHHKFHEMYPVLGFKKVKDAINAAIASWCEQNEAEFRRRKGK